MFQELPSGRLDKNPISFLFLSKNRLLDRTGYYKYLKNFMTTFNTRYYFIFILSRNA